MTKSKYLFKQMQDDEWHAPRRKNYGLQCCDCGLVHRVDFKLIKYGRGKRIILRARRDDHSTLWARKARGIRVITK